MHEAKITLSFIAVTLWVFALFLPAYVEPIAELEHSGWEVLLLAIWGCLYFIGMPWAAINAAFFMLLWMNVFRVESRPVSWGYFIAVVSLTVIHCLSPLDWPTLRYTGVVWESAMIVWNISLFMMAIAAFLPITDKTEKTPVAQHRTNATASCSPSP